MEWLAGLLFLSVIVLLLAVLYYEYRTGALDWGLKRRAAAPGRYARSEGA